MNPRDVCDSHPKTLTDPAPIASSNHQILYEARIISKTMNLDKALKSRTLIKLNHDAGYFDAKFESYCYSAVFSYKVIPEGKLLSL